MQKKIPENLVHKKFYYTYNFNKKKTFFCDNNRKSNKIVHCVDYLFYFSGSFEDMCIFHVFQLSFTNKNRGGGRFNPPPPSKLRLRIFKGPGHPSKKPYQ